MTGLVQLEFGVSGARRMAFAPLTGACERAAPGPDLLLQTLALPGDGWVFGAAIDQLTVGDRDRAIAGLYRQLYGDAILADAVCTGCAATYEIRFGLADLVASRRPDGSAGGDPPVVTLGQSRLRLPTIADLSGPADGFLARLTLQGPAPDPETASQALENADPALELDLSGICPECQAVQTSPFSVSAFLRAALRRDLGFLTREVHLIASTYHWSFDEILRLSRQERQSFARLLIAEREAAASPLRRLS